MHQKKAFQYLLLTPILAVLVFAHFACKKPTSPSFKDVYNSGSGAPLPPGATPTVGASSHAFIKAWGFAGSGAGQFNSPHFIAVDDVFNVFVSDYGNNRIQKFTSDGIAVTQWANTQPQGIAVDNGGNLYVAMEQPSQVQETDINGNAIGVAPLPTEAVTWVDNSGATPVTNVCTWLTTGPMGVAYSPSGDQFYASSFTASSGSCDPLWDFTRVLWQTHVSPHVTTPMWATISVFNPVPPGPTYQDIHANLIGVAIDHVGDNIYWVDEGNDFIYRFPLTSSGGAPMTMGTEGIGNSQFHSPHGIAVDRTGNVYVADTTNYRIQIFDKDLTYISQFGGEGTGAGQFESPWAVTVDKYGYIYVTDTGNNRIQKFAP